MKIKPIAFLLFSLISNIMYSQQPVELGDVNWIRDLDEATDLSELEEKPIFILFQEVPGCLNCRNYGQNVLSHPLIVEAIETLFIPVAILNNKRGKDADVLIFFHEASWNNPVVRIVDKDKRDIVDRLSGNYTKAGVVGSMIKALSNSNIDIPNYLSLMNQEFTAEGKSESVYLSMYCFWTGEKEIGKLNGVVDTEAGFMDGREVVRVNYHPEVIELEELITEADAVSCAQQVYAAHEHQRAIAENVIEKNRIAQVNKFRPDRQPKYFLNRSIYRFIPMTQIQASRVNSLIGQNQLPDRLLSRRQLQLLEFFSINEDYKFKNMLNLSIEDAWPMITKYLAS